MSATDELRRLLDERGVEYETNDGMGAYYIRQSVLSSGKLTAENYALENMLLKIDNDTRWYELFGTPERAARTMAGKCCDCLECVIVDACEYGEGEGCPLDNYDALLEWLRGDAE